MRFRVTESGPADGRPVLALHGWPQHHWHASHFTMEEQADLVLARLVALAEETRR